jgi:hypothetical protein
MWIDVVSIPGLIWGMSFAGARNRLLAGAPAGLLAGETLAASVWSVGVHAIGLATMYVSLCHAWFFVGYHSDKRLSDWAERGNNFETEFVWLWTAYILIDLAVVCSFGGRHREAWWRNAPLVGVVALLGAWLGWLLVLGQATEAGCIFKVNCERSVYERISDHWINKFLFPYDHVGGVWDGVVPSTEFPLAWKMVMVAGMAATSWVHGLGVRYLHERRKVVAAGDLGRAQVFGHIYSTR